MIDRGAQAFTRQAVNRNGLDVIFQRVSGVAPRAVTFSVEVKATLAQVKSDTEEEERTGYPATKPGSISQDDRSGVVMVSDLKAKRFPLPLAKGDNVIVKMTGEKFSLTNVDAFKRHIAGAIEFTATGVS